MAKRKKSLSAPTRIEQFAASFEDEAELRLALISLLERLPNTKGIRHTHGTAELGKDIVFTSAGPFARDELVACVVKNARITGSAESGKGARTVYIQAEQCLDTPVLNHKGIPERISRVYVITPHECSSQSISSITGKLNKPADVVRFIFGRELFDLFEEHHPDYLLFKSGLFGSYVSDLERGVSADGAIANVLIKQGLSGSSDSVKRIYIQPNFAQRICSYRLKVSRPHIDAIRGRVTQEQVLDFASGLRSAGMLLMALARPRQRKTFDGALTKFAADVGKDWEVGLRHHLTHTAIEPLKRVRKEAKVELPNFDSLSDRFVTLMEDSLGLLDAFEDQLGLANQFASSHISNFQQLVANPYNYSYSYIWGLAGRLPGLIVPDGFVTTIPCTSREINKSTTDFLITGPAGFGKTTFCRWHVLNDLRQLKENIPTPVPVYIPLHRLSGSEAAKSVENFLEFAGAKNLWETRDADGSSRKFRFYLDGLDEMPDEEDQRRLLGLVGELKRLAPDTQVIMTGRDHVSGAHLDRLIRLQVTELDDPQLEEFIDAWFVGDTLGSGLFRAQLARIESLRLVMRVPLLATLVLSVFSSTGTVPESRVKLYEMFINLMAGGWDVAKGIQRGTQFGPQPKITVLQRLAGRLQIGGRRDASAFDFAEAVRDQLAGLGGKKDLLLAEIIQDGLMVPLGDKYVFSHHSFQEFLAAKDLIEPSGKRASLALSAYLLGETWWRDVLSFYVTLSDQPSAMEQFIRESVVKAARRTFDGQIIARARYLLEYITTAYPGACPDFDFPELAGFFRQVPAESKER